MKTDSGAIIDCVPAFQLLVELCANYSADRAAQITSVPAPVIRQLARDFADAKPAAIRIGYGVDRWYYSDYTARAAANLVIATGNIGIAGGGISVHDGTYAAPLNLNPFRTPGGRQAATLDIIGLMRAIEHDDPYPVRSLWLSASNMFNQTSANRSHVLRDILPKLELFVAVDLFMTDTAIMADIVLPACSIFEKSDLIAGMFLQLQRQVVAPEGESKADLDIFAGLAQRMGLEQFFDRSPEDYLREMLESNDPLLSGISLDRLQREDALLLNRPAAPYVGLADLRFNTPSGRIELYKEELVQHGAELPCYREPIEATPKNSLYSKYPLTLIFSHSRSPDSLDLRQSVCDKRTRTRAGGRDPSERRRPAPVERCQACAGLQPARQRGTQVARQRRSASGRGGDFRGLLGQGFSQRRSLQPDP